MPNYVKKVEIPGKNAQELYDTVAKEIEKFIENLSLGSFEIERKPEAKEVRLKASMVTATLSCGEECLQLDAKLSLLAAPFRSKIDEGIDRWLVKTFGLSR